MSLNTAIRRDERKRRNSKEYLNSRSSKVRENSDSLLYLTQLKLHRVEYAGNQALLTASLQHRKMIISLSNVDVTVGQ